MRHPAPLFFLLTLSFLTQARIIQFWQRVKAIIPLPPFSRHIPTLTQSGGMNGGMESPLDGSRLGMPQQGV